MTTPCYCGNWPQKYPVALVATGLSTAQQCSVGRGCMFCSLRIEQNKCPVGTYRMYRMLPHFWKVSPIKLFFFSPSSKKIFNFSLCECLKNSWHTKKPSPANNNKNDNSNDKKETETEETEREREREREITFLYSWVRLYWKSTELFILVTEKIFLVFLFLRS